MDSISLGATSFLGITNSYRIRLIQSRFFTKGILRKNMNIREKVYE